MPAQAKGCKNCIEYEIYLPLARPSAAVEKKCATIKKQLVDFFGGMTDTRHRNDGIWKASGKRVHDDIVIWKIVSHEKAAGDRLIRKLKSELELLLKQDKILVVRSTAKTM